MAGWRVSIEEKDNGTVNLWHDDVPGSSGQAFSTHESWEDAVEHLEGVRDEFKDTYDDLGPEVKDHSGSLPFGAEKPEKGETDTETAEKKSATTKPSAKK